MALVTVLVLALCLSADGLGVGFAYGSKGVRLPAASIAIVSAISAAIFFVSSVVGAEVEQVVGDLPARLLGAAILSWLGVWLIRDALRERAATVKVEHSSNNLWVVVQEPERADLDRSGTISSYEAILLGLALAVDSAGAGAGVTLAGSPPWWSAAVVALVNAAFLAAGLKMGRTVTLRLARAAGVRAADGAGGCSGAGAAAEAGVLASVQAFLPGSALILVALLGLII